MEREVQLSAVVSPAIKALLERHVRATGVKKGHLIQEALAHHLAALDALPSDVILPTRLVLSKQSGTAVALRILSPKAPRRALRELMQRK